MASCMELMCACMTRLQRVSLKNRRHCLAMKNIKSINSRSCLVLYKCSTPFKTMHYYHWKGCYFFYTKYIVLCIFLAEFIWVEHFFGVFLFPLFVCSLFLRLSIVFRTRCISLVYLLFEHMEGMKSLDGYRWICHNWIAKDQIELHNKTRKKSG